MREIINENLGHFYIENMNDREEQDKVKIYDSEMNYLDYLPLDCDDDETPDQPYSEYILYGKYIAKLESFETIEDMLEWLVLDCDFVGFKDETIRWITENWYLDDEDAVDPLDNEWINRIGNTYIVVSEY